MHQPVEMQATKDCGRVIPKQRTKKSGYLLIAEYSLVLCVLPDRLEESLFQDLTPLLFPKLIMPTFPCHARPAWEARTNALVICWKGMHGLQSFSHRRGCESEAWGCGKVHGGPQQHDRRLSRIPPLC